MNRPTVRTVAVFGFALGLLTVTLLAAGTAVPQVTDTDTESSPGTKAGETLASHSATIESDIRTASFETRLATADTPSMQAQVIAAELSRTESQVARLESRLRTLETARENGSLDQQTYESRLSRLSSNARTNKAILDEIQSRVADIDTTSLQQANVTTERINTLQSRTDNLVAAGGERTSGGLEPEFYRQVRTVATAYNQDVASQDLGVFGTYLNNERVNLHVVRDDGETEIISFRTTADSRVHDLRAGPHPDADLRVTVDESTARNVIESDNPGSTANQAFLEGEIAIDGLGRYNALRWLAVNAVLAVFRLVVGIVNFILGVFR